MTKEIHRFWGAYQKMQLPTWSIPLALLAVCVLAFGLLIPWLGFYQDDWHFVYYAYTRGAAGLIELLNYDGHPLAAALYVPSFQLLGHNPVAWQLFSLFWRWLAVATFWLVLHRLWPAHRRATFTAAALYAIFPQFTLQPLAISYFEIWISHFLLAASFLLTIEALKQPKRFWLFAGLAVLLKILHFFSSEYTWGMELMRPLIIWFVLPAAANETTRQRLAKTFQIYLPFLLLFAVMLVWRGLLYQSPVLSRSDPHLFTELLANPLAALKDLIFNALPDFFQILFSTWFRLFDPLFFDFSKRLNLLVTGLVAVSAAGLTWFLAGLDRREAALAPEGTAPWLRDAFLLGAAGLVFGMIPFYAAGYFILQKIEPWNGRFVLGSMPGAALMLTVLLETWLAAPKKRLVAAALILSLGIGWQTRVANDFRQATEKQRDFYEQWTWRAPAIAPDTALIADGEVLPIMGDYPTSFAFNSVYQVDRTPEGQIPYWFYAISSNFDGRIEQLHQGTPLTDKRHSTTFAGQSLQSLYFSFEPQSNQCLWLVRPEYADYPPYPDKLGAFGHLNALDRIQPTPQADFSVLRTIFGSEPAKPWCYYFEKAELAAQFQDWKTVTGLWTEATRADLKPGHGLEYLSFIEAFARQGDWKTAQALSMNANRINQSMGAVLCPFWKKLTAETPDSPEKDASAQDLREKLLCSP